MTPSQPPRPHRPRPLAHDPSQVAEPRPGIPLTLVKNLLGLLLLIGGGAGLVVVAFLTHPLLGAGVTSAVVMAAGFQLATSEA